MINFPWSLTILPLHREPIMIGEDKTQAVTKSGLKPTQEASKAHAAGLAPEPA